MRTCPLVSSGGVHMWLELFADGYGRVGNKGIYMAVSNSCRSVKNFDDNHFLLALLKKGECEDTVFRAIIAKLSEYRYNSESLPVHYVEQYNEFKQVSVAISILPCDYVQLCHHCGHGGNNSRANCPTCIVLKTNRLDKADIQFLNMRRNKFFDEACERQIALEAGSGGQFRVQEIRKRYGFTATSRGAPLLEAMGGDCASACFRDRSHLFYFGLFQDILETVLAKMNTDIQAEALARINLYVWPSHVECYTQTWRPGQKLGHSINMRLYRQLFFVAVTAFRGLISTDLLDHMLSLWNLHTLISQPEGLTVDEVKLACAQLEKIVASGRELLIGVYDKPNGHNLIELVKHDLPLLRNVHFTETDAWERMHRYGKRESDHFPKLTHWLLKDTITLIVHGTPWYVDAAQKRLTEAARSISDYRPGHEGSLSPILLGTSSFIRGQQAHQAAKGLPENGGWLPVSFQQTSYHHKRRGGLFA